MRLVALALWIAGCGATVPETHYYDLAPAPSAGSASAGSGSVIAIEPLVAEGAYDDDRIVYRPGAYRLDYYPYRRWSAPPGTLIGDYLADAFARSGRFRAVLRDAGSTAALTLGGRVIAIEEVDLAPARWVGRIALELELSDAGSGRLIWSARFDETEPMAAQTPDALARALSVAMRRVSARAIDRVANTPTDAVR